MKRKKGLWMALCALCLGMIFVLFELWYSYDYLTVANYAFSTAKLTAPVHAVILADMHDHEFGRDNARLIAAVQAEKPDFILMVGDMLNRDSADAEKAIALIRALSDDVPVYYAMGNHEIDYAIARGDYAREGLAAQLMEAGATVFDRGYADIDVRGQKLRIGGMYDYAYALDGRNSTNPDRMNPAVYQFLTEFQDTELLTLMLAHRPDSFIFGEASATWAIDLVISGHLHGGQVVLPFLGGVWGGDQYFFPEYVYGMYEKDKLNLLITSGLGSNVQKVPRFNNPPEIVSLNLVPAEE